MVEKRPVLMTEKQKQYADQIVAKVKEAVGNDENFGDFRYHEDKAHGGVYFHFFIKQVPNYKYAGIPLSPDQLWQVDTAAQIFIESWAGSTQEDIDGFIRFIRAGEKYGWD